MFCSQRILKLKKKRRVCASQGFILEPVLQTVLTTLRIQHSCQTLRLFIIPNFILLLPHEKRKY